MYPQFSRNETITHKPQVPPRQRRHPRLLRTSRGQCSRFGGTPIALRRQIHGTQPGAGEAGQGAWDLRLEECDDTSGRAG